MTLNKNEIIKLTITGMTSFGSGVGRTEDNFAVFVPDSAVGDELLVKILKVEKNLAYAKIDSIIKPSESRITPDCKVCSRCGGCVYRHIDYNHEKDIKYNKVKDAVERIGTLGEIKINPIIGAENPDRYRNKAQIPVALDNSGNAVMGFYARHSHTVVKCDDCLLSPKIFSDIANVVLDFFSTRTELIYEEKTHSGKVRHLFLRVGEISGEIMVCFVVNGDSFFQQDVLFNSIIEKFPAVKSIILNMNTEDTNVILGKHSKTVYGKDTINDTLCSLEFELSLHSFYQVNRTQAEILYSIVSDYAAVKSSDTLIDLYCGTGTIGLSMAKYCKKLIGVEIIKQAVENARRNAIHNNIDNAEFFCMDAEKAAQKFALQNISPDVVIVDPPRKGLTKELIKTIAFMSPARVVYVSCDPATMARDLKLFTDNSYTPQMITPVDLFPRTAHVESVALLSKI